MKTGKFLITTILSTGLLLNLGFSSYAADSIVKSTVNTVGEPIKQEELRDPRIAATSFIEHVNFARVALAMKNADLANRHIAQAESLVAVIKNSTAEQRKITEVETGRVIYQYDTDYKYHYFPIEAGLAEVKQMSNGPIWAKDDLAVTDADIVYLTLDLTGNKTENYLNEAKKAIISSNLKDADNQLAKLTDDVIKVSDEIALPNVVAHDNIALARSFIAAKNYSGASYALKHADEALDKMENNPEYKSHNAEIISMRKDVSELQANIAKKNPTLINKANAKMDKWWKELKKWSTNKVK